ncbi:MAG TPA: response regulator, partial [Planctomycetota bacterium]
MDKTIRALIVEDNEDDAQMLLRELERGGYRVAHRRVETPAAMREALSEPWDIVLSDYSMPSFNAPAALELLRSTGIDLPFIIISGTIGEEVAVASLKAGADDFLVKGRLARLVPAVGRELRQGSRRLEVAAMEERRRAVVALNNDVTLALSQALDVRGMLQLCTESMVRNL